MPLNNVEYLENVPVEVPANSSRTETISAPSGKTMIFLAWELLGPDLDVREWGIGPASVALLPHGGYVTVKNNGATAQQFMIHGLAVSY